MLTWFKRIAANSPREQTAETQTQTPSTEEKVERLVGRLGTGRKPEGEELAAEASHEDSQEAQVSQEVSQELPREIPREVPRVTSPTRVIAVAAQKGGAGKTTITAHLAVQAGLVGQGPVVLADTDPQGSLGQWSRARNDENLPLASVRLEELAANPAALRNSGAAIALIDTPPALTTSIEQVIGIADLILIPARPSPHDLRAIGATVELVRRAGKPFVFVVNGAAPRANITAEAVAALSEHGPVAPVILYQRTDYAASMIDGRTVMETAPDGRSAQEIVGLWSYIYAQISLREAA